MFCESRLQRITDLAQRYVDQEIISGWNIQIGGREDIYFQSAVGHREIETQSPMQFDTVVRIASMTKAIASVGAMMLYERGEFLLTSPIKRFLPQFSNMQVLAGQRDEQGQSTLRAATSDITIQQLLSHTSGFGYFHTHRKLGEYYKEAGVHDWGYSDGTTLAEWTDRLSTCPLAFDPGKRFLYGVNTDVVGRLIEVISGQSFEAFVTSEILDPLGMADTAFYPTAEMATRLAPVYSPNIDESVYDGMDYINAKATYDPSTDCGLRLLPEKAITTFVNLDFDAVARPHEINGTFFSGGAGLHSTLIDYSKFLQMLTRGGELNGTRLISPETLRVMRTNQIGDLPIDIGGVGHDRFGLGFGIVVDAGRQPYLCQEGNYFWGGAYNTQYFLDPVNEFYAVMMNQLYPNFHCELNKRVKGMVYQAMV